MIVRQIYAGWIGVIVNNKVQNATSEYELNGMREEQLTPYRASQKEIRDLIVKIKESNPYGYKPYVDILRRELR